MDSKPDRSQGSSSPCFNSRLWRDVPTASLIIYGSSRGRPVRTKGTSDEQLSRSALRTRAHILGKKGDKSDVHHATHRLIGQHDVDSKGAV